VHVISSDSFCRPSCTISGSPICRFHRRTRIRSINCNRITRSCPSKKMLPRIDQQIPMGHKDKKKPKNISTILNSTQQIQEQPLKLLTIGGWMGPTFALGGIALRGFPILSVLVKSRYFQLLRNLLKITTPTNSPAWPKQSASPRSSGVKRGPLGSFDIHTNMDSPKPGTRMGEWVQICWNFLRYLKIGHQNDQVSLLGLHKDYRVWMIWGRPHILRRP